LQLADGEDAELLVLPAHSNLPPVDAAHCISHDQHLFSRQHLIQPAVEYSVRDNFGSEFLGKLALYAGNGIFPAFQSTTRQFPFVAFVQEKYDLVALQEDTLDRYRKRIPLSPSKGIRATARVLRA
jgi:hypothetical protein